MKSGHRMVRDGFSLLLMIFCISSVFVTAQDASLETLPPAIPMLIDSNADTQSVVVPTLAPPSFFAAIDSPNDAGKAIDLSWTISPDDRIGGGVVNYRLYRSELADRGFVKIADILPGMTTYTDRVQQNEAASEETEDSTSHDVVAPSSSVPDVPPFEAGKLYYYKIASVDVNGVEVFSTLAGPASSIAQYYHSGKTPVLVLVLVFFVLVVVLIQVAKFKGNEMYIRPIAGISEIDNAIGRATEMGRPILYVMGLGAPEDIATIASYTILARVAKKTAEYKTNLLVPCNEPIVMTIAQETVKNAYMEAGHPDLYNDNMVFFVTSMQFAYVAAVNGLMLRERTATNCYFGKFYAESLLLSEAGNIAGSIQVAGTDEVAQLPFFVTTCDYTLIGEELYAASAYLGRDPLLLGALKAQDYIKAIVMLVILIGSILISFGSDFILNLVTVNM